MTDTDKFITPYLSRQHPEELTSVQEYSALGDQPCRAHIENKVMVTLNQGEVLFQQHRGLKTYIYGFICKHCMHIPVSRYVLQQEREAC